MIYYRNGYKNQLAESFEILTPIHPWKEIQTEFINLDEFGFLNIMAGYCWDGASGPTIDKPVNQILVPSLIHDAFCQLIRTGELTIPDARLQADKYFHTLLRERGMNPVRAWVWYRGVRYGARHHRQKPKPILEAL